MLAFEDHIEEFSEEFESAFDSWDLTAKQKSEFKRSFKKVDIASAGGLVKTDLVKLVQILGLIPERELMLSKDEKKFYSFEYCESYIAHCFNRSRIRWEKVRNVLKELDIANEKGLVNVAFLRELLGPGIVSNQKEYKNLFKGVKIGKNGDFSWTGTLF